MKAATVIIFLFASYILSGCSTLPTMEKDGGLKVTLTIGYSDFIQTYAANQNDSNMNRIFSEIANEKVSDFAGYMDLYLKTQEKLFPGAKLAGSFMSFEMSDKVNFNTSNDEMKKILQIEWDAVITKVTNVIKSRLEKIDVENVTVTISNGNNFIVEIPGVKEEERIMKLLPDAGELGFWETYQNAEFFPYLNKVNDYLKSVNFKFAEDTLNTNNQAVDSTDLVALIESQNEESDKNSLAENPLFNILKPATSQEGNLQPGAVIGYVNLSDTAKFNQLIKMDSVLYLMPRDSKIKYALQNPTFQENYLEVIVIKCTTRDGKPAIDGTVITEAKAEMLDSRPEISITMNAEGAKMWKRMTAENVGRQIAITLDGIVYSFPMVQSEIEGGKSIISGNFTVDEAGNLASILSAGKYPVKFSIVKVEVVEAKK